ncbi:hypothetical protein HLB42_21535 (plasmid) [Deinococcus sp. D7000]|nr:hypothetical protein HLB42_13810 [Deinococcus sp. D7000]QLG13524.1 hypothetical protein HLB42_21535 [Deinococcus sp. D7000]
MIKQFILKDDAEPGIYPGLGVAEHGQPLTAYSEEQEAAFAADKRFKVHHAPKDDALTEPEADKKPAKTGKDGK